VDGGYRDDDKEGRGVKESDLVLEMILTCGVTLLYHMVPDTITNNTLPFR